ncbi:hypothetical protein NRS6183_11510 [Bacillus subtilis]|nr:hypothetical protein NRS6183_03088 [Bacillus subtilis]CAI6275022.1 hypothetical protein NRS6183_11510 [Bacillus subtilis]
MLIIPISSHPLKINESMQSRIVLLIIISYNQIKNGVSMLKFRINEWD